MNNKKIYILTVTGFSYRDYERYGFKFLFENNIEIVIWDCTSFVYPQLVEKNSSFTYDGKIDNIEIKSKYELERLMSKVDIEKDFVYSLVYLSLKTYEIFLLFKKYDIKYILSFMGPTISGLHNKSLRFLINQVVKRILFRFKVLSLPKKIFTVNEAYNMIYPFKESETKIIEINSFDCNKCLETGSITKKNDYVVFLDQYIPYHPDLQISGKSLCSSPEKYYSDLNSYFDLVEEYTGKEVLIAAHPRSKSKGDKFFKHRKTIIGETIELVANSSLVLLHNSTSVNYAFYYNKDIVFIKSDNYSNIFNKNIQKVSDILGAKTSNLNLKELNINKYSSLKNKSIKSFLMTNRKDGKMNSEIILESLYEK
ncbi:MAG: hypothetical protein N4A49_15370 [Marinifilaceae bacterium]|jgi:hypothetical protein|nr:hypothetical protein [Marinifilaceae bacterium]